MYQLLAEKCTGYILKQQIGKIENKIIYTYLFEVMISLVIDTLLVLLLGIVTHQFAPVLIYMIFYILLRISSGGAHMPGYFSCILFFIATAFFVLMLHIY